MVSGPTLRGAESWRWPGAAHDEHRLRTLIGLGLYGHALLRTSRTGCFTYGYIGSRVLVQENTNREDVPTNNFTVRVTP